VFEQRNFLLFHNAINSGRKLFKNDILRPLQTKFFEKFRSQAPVKSAIAIEEVNEGTLRKVAWNLVKRVGVISNTYCNYRLVVQHI
jgi:hypothetical protein